MIQLTSPKVASIVSGKVINNFFSLARAKSMSQSTCETCRLPRKYFTNRWLRGPPQSLGLGPLRCSPSMQPAENNQGVGTTQIRHQHFCQ